MHHRLLGLIIVAALLLPVQGCSPSEPSSDESVPLASIRYVRTRPVTVGGGDSRVVLGYSWPIPGDPYRRARTSAVALRARDDTTFVYDYPENFVPPADRLCSFWVSDEAVSPYFVARDIYVNGTRIAVEVAGDYEYGRFRVTRDGRVY